MHDREQSISSRRDFLEKIFAVTVVAVAGPSVVLGRIVPALSASKGALAGRYRIDLTDPAYAALTQVGGSILLESIAGVTFSVIVTRTAEATFAAVNATCTHQGCTVNEVTPESNNRLVCPCHGSEFTPTGAVVRGPATRALKTYQTFFDGGDILEIEIAGIASTPAEVAAGAFVGSPFVDRDAARVTLPIALEAVTELRAAVYTMTGLIVATAFDGRLGAGEHEVSAPIDGVAAGAYIIRVEAGDRGVISRKFVVSR
jgi:Rieske Fe-S protein